ncbi:Sulfate adenylyltransferase subunit 2 [Labeo rohita]|uniref:Sulfate adenylyltransferase subunit 2 n=1 Tax=Labeo rohita TaxID=84645 RepID=A0ABQ8L0Y4_LABRO|nr:Sulfate adenylyltransferase subunit 2 [Labeo rohita]
MKIIQSNNPVVDSGVINSGHKPKVNSNVKSPLQCPFEKRTLAEKLKVKDLGSDQPDLFIREERKRKEVMLHVKLLLFFLTLFHKIMPNVDMLFNQRQKRNIDPVYIKAAVQGFTNTLLAIRQSHMLCRDPERQGGYISQNQNETIEKKRECLLRALCVYLNEDPSSLFHEYLDSDGSAAQRDLEQIVFGIYSINAEGGDATNIPVDVGIVIEGVEVLQDLGDIASACALLMGVIYAMNLSYPQELKTFFEVLQKIFFQLDATRLSTKSCFLLREVITPFDVG